MKNLNIRPETLKLLKEATGNTGTNRYRQGLPQYNPSSPATKRKDGQMGLHKLKSFCTTKEMVSKLRDNPQSGRKYLPAIHQARD
jgi:hypothetical protein